ncbi:MAG: hypothetical protein J0I07_15320 [Myxococcales bacterium]|nr:hypothetical protein [Myxococcales bacterium]
MSSAGPSFVEPAFPHERVYRQSAAFLEQDPSRMRAIQLRQQTQCLGRIGTKMAPR